MAIFKYSGIGISGISAAVPKEKNNNLTPNDFFTEKDTAIRNDAKKVFHN